MAFNPVDHVFTSPKVRAIVDDAINFLNQTSAYQLPPPDPFVGTGVYCLYHLGDFNSYKKIACLNMVECMQPLYIGKAVPRAGERHAQKAKRIPLCTGDFGSMLGVLGKARVWKSRTLDAAS